jgi:hypothetical protein
MASDNENKKRHIVVCGTSGGGGGTVEWDDIQDKPSFATVATSGDYNDLSNKPAIPAAQVQSDWNEADSTSMAYIQNKPSIYNEWFGTQAQYDLISPKDPDTIYHIEGDAPEQSDWNEADTTSMAYIKNKPTIPAAQVQSDWNANSGMGEILNKPSMSTETLTFTLQGGTTQTVVVYVQPQI